MPSQHGHDRCTKRARLDTTCPVPAPPCIQSCMLRAVTIVAASFVCVAPSDYAPAFSPQLWCGKRAEQSMLFTLWWTLSGVATHSDKP